MELYDFNKSKNQDNIIFTIYTYIYQLNCINDTIRQINNNHVTIFKFLQHFQSSELTVLSDVNHSTKQNAIFAIIVSFIEIDLIQTVEYSNFRFLIHHIFHDSEASRSFRILIKIYSK